MADSHHPVTELRAQDRRQVPVKRQRTFAMSAISQRLVLARRLLEHRSNESSCNGARDSPSNLLHESDPVMKARQLVPALSLLVPLAAHAEPESIDGSSSVNFTGFAGLAGRFDLGGKR
jgi:hypothetical protein